MKTIRNLILTVAFLSVVFAVNAQTEDRDYVPSIGEFTNDTSVVNFLNRLVKTVIWTEIEQKTNTLPTFNGLESVLKFFQTQESGNYGGDWLIKGENCSGYSISICCANSHYSGGLPYLRISVASKKAIGGWYESFLLTINRNEVIFTRSEDKGPDSRNIQQKPWSQSGVWQQKICQ